MIASADVVRAAREYVGVPFRRGGRNRAGLDCAGLLAVVCDALGVTYRDVAKGYSFHMSFCAQMALHITEFAQHIETSAAAPGDIVQFKVGTQCHIGILTDAGVVHAWLTVRKVVESPIASDWRKGMTVYRFNGIGA